MMNKMKIKATITINMGLYMDIRPEVEIEVPENLTGPELALWLHKEYFGLLDGRKVEPPQGEPDEFQVIKAEFAGPKKRDPLKYRAAKWTPPQQGDETQGTVDQVLGVGDPPQGAKAEGYEGGESVSGQQ